MNLSLPDIPIARDAYEEFIYTIREHAQSIQISTLVLKMIAPHKAEVEGALYFANDIRLEVSEAVSLGAQASLPASSHPTASRQGCLRSQATKSIAEKRDSTGTTAATST